MKHILSLLTIALLGAATTVFATDAFDDYAQNYGYYSTNLSYDSYYAVEPGTKTQTIDYGTYQVIKEAYASDNSVEYQSRFRIHVNGDSSSKVDFYLYDFYDNAQSPTNGSSLKDQGVTQVGYRLLDSDNDFSPMTTTESTDVHPLGAGEKETVIKPAINAYNSPTEMTRYKYHLGTFSGGSDFEIYMSKSDDAASGVWSYSSVDDQVAGYLGGATQPENILYLNVDKLMMAYEAGQVFNFNAEDSALIKQAAAAMPLAWLAPSGAGLSFGIQGTAVPSFGSPLPGGLPIAIVAGLFGLGFWFIRRRKAVTA